MSHIYGDTSTNKMALRAFKNGKLKARIFKGEEYPPFNSDCPELNGNVSLRHKPPRNLRKSLILKSVVLYLWYGYKYKESIRTNINYKTKKLRTTSCLCNIK